MSFRHLLLWGWQLFLEIQEAAQALDVHIVLEASAGKSEAVDDLVQFVEAAVSKGIY